MERKLDLFIDPSSKPGNQKTGRNHDYTQKNLEDFEDLPEHQNEKLLAFLGSIELNKVDLNDSK